MAPWCVAGLEGLDDDHPPAAGRAGIGEHRRLIGIHIIGLALWCWDAEQPARAVEVLGTAAVGEQAVVSDAVAALGQDVEEETTDELVRGQRHGLVSLAAFCPVVRGSSGNAEAAASVTTSANEFASI